MQSVKLIFFEPSREWKANEEKHPEEVTASLSRHRVKLLVKIERCPSQEGVELAWRKSLEGVFYPPEIVISHVKIAWQKNQDPLVAVLPAGIYPESEQKIVNWLVKTRREALIRNLALSDHDYLESFAWLIASNPHFHLKSLAEKGMAILARGLSCVHSPTDLALLMNLIVHHL